jgi:uncharacterized membrane protein YfcA
LIAPIDIVLFIGIGSLCGLLAGFLGVGGGIILVPFLTLFFRSRGILEENLMHLSFGTSLAIALLASIASTYQHHHQKSISWKAVGPMAAGGLTGAWIGATVAVHVTGLVLKIIFMIVLAASAIKMFFEKQKTNPEDPRPSILWILVGFISGFIAPLAGIGGGIVLVPAMIYMLHFPIKKIVGTSSGVIIFTAAVSTIKYIYHGWHCPSLPEGCFGFVCPLAALPIGICSMFTAPIGAFYQQKIKGHVFKKMFGILLFIVGLRILFSTI